jgi:hypothetical protein
MSEQIPTGSFGSQGDGAWGPHYPQAHSIRRPGENPKDRTPGSRSGVISKRLCGFKLQGYGRAVGQNQKKGLQKFSNEYLKKTGDALLKIPWARTFPPESLTPF